MSDPDPPFVFDLDGGRVCLDFVNTATSSAEHLNAYADLLAFATQSHLLTPEQAIRLQHAADRAPRAAGAILDRGKDLRSAVRSIFMAVAAQTPPPAPAVDTLNVNLAASLANARVIPDAHGYAWGWAVDSADLAAPLWPIVRSAADMLTSEDERRLVRECGADDCGWLFVDTTRNRSRQWCSMSSCGNREKARRHYQRVKAQRTPRTTPASEADAALPTRPPARRTPAGPAGAASATAD